MEEDNLLRKLNKAKREHDPKTVADVQKKLGDLYYDKKRHEDALEAYKGQLQACECLSDKLSSAIAHRMIGEVFADIGSFNEALEHQNLYLRIAKELEDYKEQQRAYATLGRTYLLVADSLIKESEINEKNKALKDSEKNFFISIKICDKLQNKINIYEWITMKARLLLNLGLVSEQQKKMEEALKYIEQAGSLCKKHNLHDDLHRTNMALSSLNERLGNTDLALKNLDDAIKVDDVYLKADARLARAELLLRLGNWAEAKNTLLKLYKSNQILEPIKQQVNRLLRIAVVLYQNENKLQKEVELSTKEKLYETMGDAASAVKSWEKAIEYYRNMLSCADETQSSQIGPALTSLSQTLRDAGKIKEAIPFARRELKICSDPKEACNSALYLVNLLIDANHPHEEIQAMFEHALNLAKQSEDRKLQKLVIREFLEYFNKVDTADKQVIESLKERLDDFSNSQSSMEFEPETESPEIGADICLDELTDDDNDDFVSRVKPQNVYIGSKRSRFIIKKNEKGETLLHVACIKGNISIVEKLLDENHPTAVRDHCGWTPLHEAANHGFVEIVKLLVRAGADVNDPGGISCDGVTPLHDAAANGHMDVVQLLLESGANPNLVMRNGESALDCLEHWRERVEDMSESQKKEYEFLRKSLESVTTVREKKKKKKKKSDEGPKFNAFIDDENEHNPVLEMTVDQWVKSEKISADEDYKRTIARMQHPSRLMTPINLPILPKITAPLIDSEEMLVDDDWLDDDLGKRSKDKPYFNGAPSIPASVSVISTSKRKKKTDVEYGIEREVDKSMKRPKFSASSPEKEIIPVFESSEDSCESSTSNENFDNVFEPRSSFDQSEKWPRSRKPKQTNLLKQGFVRVSQLSSPLKVESKQQQQQQLQQSTTSTDQQLSRRELEKRRSWDSVSETLDLEIVVDGEAFELKLHIRDLRKAMSNIEELICHKFEMQTGCKPRINFKTLDGVSLAPEVILEEIPRGVDNKLNLLGEIVHNDLPPIVNRFKKVCEFFGVEPSEVMLKSLRSCDNTSTFRLHSDSEHDELEPLLKCLRYQRNLHSLDLSSARLHDLGKLLNQALAGLDNLYELHAQCCDLDIDCLNLIEALPRQIRVLDLAYNPLGAASQKKLHELLLPLRRLQTLNLRFCRLEDFVHSYDNGSLINLDVGWNPINSEGVASMLQRQLLSLNLSNTQNFHRINVIDKIFFSDFLGFTLSNLEYLELSSCQATDLDVEKILSKTPSLTRINLSCNLNVTKTSLHAILARKPTMHFIDLSGCRLIDVSPNSSLKLATPQVCTLYVQMKPEVVETWEKLWQGRGQAKKLPMNLVMFQPLY